MYQLEILIPTLGLALTGADYKDIQLRILDGLISSINVMKLMMCTS